MTFHHRSQAFTLFETIIVMAIVIVAAAIVIPSLAASWPYYKVNSGVDMVRAAWAHARAAAIEQGRPYRFSIERGGSFFRIAPDQEEYWSGGGPGDDPDGPGYVLEQPLPGGVKFIVNGDPDPDPSGGDEPAGKEADRKPSGQWETACVFLGDGTAREDVRIVFQVRGTRPIALQLRGLTGASSITVLEKK